MKVLLDNSNLIILDIHHGTVHLLLVPVGEYALVNENNKPKILNTGHYIIDSNYFSVTGMHARTRLVVCV